MTHVAGHGAGHSVVFFSPARATWSQSRRTAYWYSLPPSSFNAPWDWLYFGSVTAPGLRVTATISVN